LRHCEQVFHPLPDRLVTIDFKCLKEGTAGILDAEAFVQHKQWIRNGVDDALRLNVTDAQKAVEIFGVHQRRPCTKGSTL
jgi:hypothetical protein